jgi:hypothetical protein
LTEKSRDELIEALSKVVDLLSKEEKEIIFNKLAKENSVPLSIFKSEVSGLGAIVLYLKDVDKKNPKEIAELLNRKVPTIYSTYNKVKNKKIKLDLKSKIDVPLSVFSDRKFSVLESLVFYLKDQRHLSLVEISKLIGKSQSTVKTVYWRYNKKCQKE